MIIMNYDYPMNIADCFINHMVLYMIFMIIR